MADNPLEIRLGGRDYDLTYAGVPFWSDKGTAVRFGGGPPGKHAPDPDLLDEIDRLLPFFYLQEQQTPTAYPGRNVGALAHTWQPGSPRRPPDVKVGDFHYPVGARRWSVFRGLATTSTAKAMLEQTRGRLAKPFVMEAFPLSPGYLGSSRNQYRVETDLYMLPPRPLAEHGGRYNGLYLVTLVDERYFWQYKAASVGLNRFSTWAGLIDELGDLLGVTIEHEAIHAAYGTPEGDSQFWTNCENAAILLDAVAANLGRAVVRKLEGDYVLMTPLESQRVAVANRGRRIPGPAKAGDRFDASRVVRTAGGDIYESGVQLPRFPVGDIFVQRSFQLARESTVPEKVRVCFPKYVHGDDPVPHFLNIRTTFGSPQRPTSWYEESFGDTYNIDVPVASGAQLPITSGIGSGTVSGSIVSGLTGVSGYVHAVRTTAKALFSGEANQAPVNLSGLRSLAMRIAHDFYAGNVLGPALDECYPGTFAWDMEGLHDVCWTFSDRARQGVTRVMRAPWNQRIVEFQHAAPALSGETPVARGVGGHSVAQTWTDWLSGGDVIVTTTLRTPLLSGQLTAVFNSVDALPTQNRWRGLVSGAIATSGAELSGGAWEIIYFEGTRGAVSSGIIVSGTVPPGGPISSGLTNPPLESGGQQLNSGTLVSGGGRINIVYRAVEGNQPLTWPAGTSVRLLVPDTAYGVNKVGFGKMAWAYPHEWTSGGMAGVQVVPQTQSVEALAGGSSGFTTLSSGGLKHYSGRVWSYDEGRSGNAPWRSHEYVWLVPRNDEDLTLFRVYDGQFAGHSRGMVQLSGGAGSGVVSGTGVAPVYLVSEFSGGGDGGSSGTDCSGVIACLSGILGCGRNWVDLHTGTRYSGICTVEWDSTCTTYDPTKGDLVFTLVNATTLRLRLNGQSITRSFYRYCCPTTGPFSGQMVELDAMDTLCNGLVKIWSGYVTCPT